jgi:pyruvate dehydrogenase E2 component (dihydrolipoamide acetyltransferase)
MATLTQFVLPDLGEGLEEATVSAWLVEAGQRVDLNEPIVEIETAKATVEIPSPHAGRIARLHALAGNVVRVGEPLVTFEVEGVNTAPIAPPPEMGGVPARRTVPMKRRPVSASPAARKLARQRGVDISAVRGTGPGGRIGVDDVENAAEMGTAGVTEAPSVAEPPAAATPLVEAARTPVDGEADGDGLRERDAAPALDVPPRPDLGSTVPPSPGVRYDPYTVEPASNGQEPAPARAPSAVTVSGSSTDSDAVPIPDRRRAIANQLTRLVRGVPMVTTWRTLDCGALEAFRDELGVGPLPVVLRALAEVCNEHRALNASYRAELGEIWFHRRVNAGIATDTGQGLAVPVLRNVRARGIAEISREIARLADAARKGILRPEEITGGTITISNTGSYGSEAGTPLLVHGESAILALGVIAPRALAVDGEVVARPACTLSLTFDHRVLDGADAGRALTSLVDLLSDPRALRSLPR